MRNGMFALKWMAVGAASMICFMARPLFVPVWFIRQQQEVENLYQWHDWYAWYPIVVIGEKRWAFVLWETVQRRCWVSGSGPETCDSGTEYMVDGRVMA